MAETYKVLGQTLTGELALDNSTVKEVIAYEVPANTQASISAITITNSDATDQNYKVAFVPSEDANNTQTLDYVDNYSAGVIGSLALPNTTIMSAPNLTSISYGNGKYIGFGTSPQDYTTPEPWYSIDGVNWTRGTAFNVPMQSVNFTNIIFANNMFVASGPITPYSAYSYDGVNWVFQDLGRNAGEIAYGNGIFVITGSNNVLGYSYNGVNWTWQNYSFYSTSLIFANNKFIMFNAWNQRWESSDGMTWSSFSSGSIYPESIAYGNGLFVASYSNGLYYSSDAVSWTKTFTADNSVTNVRFGNGNFIAFAQNSSRSYYSTNGINWNRSDSPSGNWSTDAVYGSDRFIAITTSGYGGITYSYTGQNWIATTLATSFSESFAYGNNTYVYVSQGGVAYSSDGVEWMFANIPVGYRSVAYGNGVFALTGQNLPIIYSTDGINWNFESGTPPNEPVYGNGVYVAVSGSLNTIGYSTNGFDWTNVEVPVDIRSITFGNGYFVGIGIYYSVISYDGITWSNIVYLGNFYYNIAYGDGRFVAISSWPSSVASYSFDGINWSSSSVTQRNYSGIAYGNNTFVAVSGNSNAVLRSSNGISWTESSAPVENYSIKFLNGKFYLLGPWLSESVNGTSFTVIDYASPRSLVYHDGVYVKTTANTTFPLSYSLNAVNWTIVNNVSVTDTWREIRVYDVGSSLVASINGNKNETFRSVDGITWRKLFFSRNYMYLQYQNGKFLAHEQYSTNGIYSLDGINWTEISNPLINRIVSGDNKFVAFGNSVVYVSEDGLTWTTHFTPFFYELSVTYFNNNFIAIVFDFSWNMSVFYSSDGASWNLVNVDNLGYRNSFVAIDDLVLMPSVFVGDSTLYSFDGQNWTSTVNLGNTNNISVNVPKVQLLLQSLNKHFAIYNKTIASEETHEIKGGITLSAGDQIRVYSDSNEIIANVYGVELS